MMINNDFLGRRVTNEIRHAAKLAPGTCIDNDHDFNSRQIVTADIRAKLADTTVGIEKTIARRQRARINNHALLPSLSKQFGHPQLGPERITIRSHMTGDQEVIVRFDNISQSLPVDKHLVSLLS